MKWVLLVLAILVLAAVVCVIVGAMLPQSHVASRSADFKRPPGILWDMVTDVKSFPSWRPGLTSVEELPARDARRSWRETSSDGVITYEVVEADPQRRLVTSIADQELPFGGTWTYELSPSATGSTLKITEHGEVYNVFFRFMSRFVFGHHATIDSYLKALGSKLDHTPEVH